jgi:hypothetical protein
LSPIASQTSKGACVVNPWKRRADRRPVRHPLARFDKALVLSGFGVGEDVDAPSRAFEQ